MEIEYVLLLSAHCKCVVPFYKSSPYRTQNGQQKAPFLSHHTRERAQSSFIQLRRNPDQQFSAKYLMVRTI